MRRNLKMAIIDLLLLEPDAYAISAVPTRGPFVDICFLLRKRWLSKQHDTFCLASGIAMISFDALQKRRANGRRPASQCYWRATNDDLRRHFQNTHRRCVAFASMLTNVARLIADANQCEAARYAYDKRVAASI